MPDSLFNPLMDDELGDSRYRGFSRPPPFRERIHQAGERHAAIKSSVECGGHQRTPSAKKINENAAATAMAVLSLYDPEEEKTREVEGERTETFADWEDFGSEESKSLSGSMRGLRNHSQENHIKACLNPHGEGLKRSASMGTWKLIVDAGSNAQILRVDHDNSDEEECEDELHSATGYQLPRGASAHSDRDASILQTSHERVARGGWTKHQVFPQSPRSTSSEDSGKKFSKRRSISHSVFPFSANNSQSPRTRTPGGRPSLELSSGITLPITPDGFASPSSRTTAVQTFQVEGDLSLKGESKDSLPLSSSLDRSVRSASAVRSKYHRDARDVVNDRG